MLLLLVLVLMPVVAVRSATLYPDPTPVSVCEYKGKWYPEGQQFKPTPCEFCNCDHGRAMCAIADCFFTLCVDPVHDPNKCCPQCPNGPNCYGPNKQIIPAGKDVSVDANTVCRCPSGGNFLGHRQALCMVTAPPPVVVS